jgi:tRNA (cmo5U34)-methyltransferase
MKIPADWTFQNIDVAQGFDDHVREQLPWYDLATGAAAHIARHYIPNHGLIYDIGASTGNIARALQSVIEQRNANLIGIEASREMADTYQGPGQIICADAVEFDYQPHDVAIAFLVMMFLPAGKRAALLRRLFDSLNPGGALILFDKVTISSGYLSTILHRLTLAGKLANGADAQDILAKELSLIGIQRPLPERFMDMASPAKAVEVFRFGEFAGWVIEKPE